MSTARTYRCPGCEKSITSTHSFMDHASSCCPEIEVTRDTVRNYRVGPKFANHTMMGFSICGDHEHAVVKRMQGPIKLRRELTQQKRKDGKKKQISIKKHPECEFALDPRWMFQLYCTHPQCAKKWDMSRDVPIYLWSRALTAKTLGLINCSVPFDGYSSAILSEAIQASGIISDRSVNRLTLVEGLCLPRFWCTGSYERRFNLYLRHMWDMQEVLKHESVATIISIYPIPSQDHRLASIICNVEISPRLDEICASLSLCAECIMPQFHFCFTAGDCPENELDDVLALATNMLVGTVLYMDATQLRVSPPQTDEGELNLDGFHGELEKDKVRWPAVLQARQVCGELNRELVMTHNANPSTMLPPPPPPPGQAGYDGYDGTTADAAGSAAAVPAGEEWERYGESEYVDESGLHTWEPYDEGEDGVPENNEDAAAGHLTERLGVVNLRALVSPKHEESEQAKKSGL